MPLLDGCDDGGWLIGGGPPGWLLCEVGSGPVGGGPSGGRFSCGGGGGWFVCGGLNADGPDCGSELGGLVSCGGAFIGGPPDSWVWK